MFDVMQQSLHNQTYKNWKALFISERESENDNIKEVDVTGEYNLSNIYLRPDVVAYLNDCDYMVKLDDDDVILPHTLEIASKFNFDCYCDLYHTFYDVSSSLLTQQKRSWIAATCIHKKEHAVMDQKKNDRAENFINSIFYGEHGRDWIAYYKNKNILYANRNTPLYVRVISPTSITAGAKKFPIKTIDDIDMEHYYVYLKQFGAWNNLTINEFIKYKNQLIIDWKAFSGKTVSSIPNILLCQKIKERIKYILNI